MTELTYHWRDLPATHTNDTADRHPALVYLASLSASSRRTMTQSLNLIAGILGITDHAAVPWGALRYQHTQAIRSALAERCAPATGNRHLAALRGVLREAWRLGYISADDYQRAIDLKAIPGTSAKAGEKGRHLSAGEIDALIRSCVDGTPAGIRNAALIAVGYGCGLRRAELAGLLVTDYIDTTESLRVIGKGRKERIVYLPPGAAEALRDWLTRRGAAPGPLFLAIRKGGEIQPKGMTPQAIYSLLAHHAAKAGVRRFSPHDLRRTFAGDLLDAGEDLATVQQIMGHADANTTAGYDRRGGRNKQRAANRLHVPYHGVGA